MPELPEVETIRREASRVLPGLKIRKVEILDNKPIKGQKQDFLRLKGVSFKKVRRFGKILVFDLCNGQSLLVHLKLTGQLVYVIGDKTMAGGHYEKGSLRVPNKYTRLVFYLNKGVLYFNDLRKFGYLKLMPTKEVLLSSEIKSLGLEPLDRGFQVSFLAGILRKTKRPVKIVLMDQSKISGIGNIYANEALFWAKVRPQRSANTLNSEETRRLAGAIKKVIRQAIALKGASENTYVDFWGKKGGFMKKVMVYQRDGEKCYLCGTKIKRIVLGGRSSFYCPKCQH